MISHRRSNRKRHILYAVACGLLSVVLLRTPLAHVSSILAPLDRLLASIERIAPNSSAWLWDHVRGVRVISLERDKAIQERNAAHAELSWLHATIPDFERVSTLLSHDDERIIAGVLSAPNESPYDTLILDAGADDGVRVGSLVFNAWSPIGTIIETAKRTSTVTLFSTPGVASIVYSPREGTMAKAIGMGGATFRVLMPHGSTVAVGDPFIMPTLGGGVIGTVARVWNDPTEPGVLAAVSASSSLRAIRMVSIDREPFVQPDAAHINKTLSAFATSTQLFNTLPEGYVDASATSTP
jgi:hypothetical protein